MPVFRGRGGNSDGAFAHSWTCAVTAGSEAPNRLDGLRVLIIEDESLLSLLLEDMLEELGCKVAGSASTVADAIEAVGKVEAGAAILDIKLGDQKSFPVAEALAARGVPFVFATGYGDGQMEDPWRDHLVLQKPFAQDQLAELLTRAVTAPPRPKGG
jgi:DNA-binding NtrC family response regulator